MSLRQAWVWDPGMYRRIEERWRADPGSETAPSWELGGFVDVRDVAAAAAQALTAPLSGHHRVLLCAADIAATRPSLAMAARFVPAAPVRDPGSFRRDPRRALLDCSAASRLLGWQPRYTSGRPRRAAPAALIQGRPARPARQRPAAAAGGRRARSGQGFSCFPRTARVSRRRAAADGQAKWVRGRSCSSPSR